MPTFREQVAAIIEHRDRYENPTDEMLSLIHQLVNETIPDGGHNTPLAERNVRRAIKRQLLDHLGADMPTTTKQVFQPAGETTAE
ncbi:MAG: hypothetical protein ACR2OE_07475 [Thermomicrobiales bacterium]